MSNKEKIIKYSQKGFFYLFILLNAFILFDFVGDIEDALDTNWIEFLNYYVIHMQNIIFMFAALSLFTKEFKLKYLVYIIPLAMLEHNLSFFSTYIHSIFHTVLYPLFSSRPDNVSPEYARIIVFTAVLLIYIVKLFFKRNFHIIFLTLGMLGVYFTAILFHTITLMQIDYFSKTQQNMWSHLTANQSIESAREKCNLLTIECQFFTKNENLFEKTENKTVKFYQPYIEKDFNLKEKFYFYTISNDNSIVNRLLSRKPLAIIKNETYQLVMFDRNHYTHYLKFNQLLFGILAFFSHVVWIFGTLYLIYFHNKMIQKRRLIAQGLKKTI